jgi:hypothetical protein
MGEIAAKFFMHDTREDVVVDLFNLVDRLIAVFGIEKLRLTKED